MPRQTNLVFGISAPAKTYDRTSPFAFTGNKFEFRMVASSASISGPNVVLNTIVAEALDEIATRLEKTKNIDKEAQDIVKEAMKEHGRIIFNGNNYSEEWPKEAAKRKLPNIKSSIEALESLNTAEAVKLFEKYKILSKSELHSRYDVYLEQYSKTINIEAQASINMVKTQYIPAVINFTTQLAQSIGDVEKAGGSAKVQKALLKEVSGHLECAAACVAQLEKETEKAQGTKDVEKQAFVFKDNVFTAQEELRKDIDALEKLVPANLWPVPTYAEMLFKM